MDDDSIPTVEIYRGIGLEADQSPQRLALVRSEIDHVMSMTDARELADWAADPRRAPEARQLACAMVEAIWAVAAETRHNRPPVDMDWLHAVTAGLGTRTWRDPKHHGSLFDRGDGIPRERPLPDE